MDPKMLELLRQQKEVLRKEGFEIVGVFGSYARGEETEESDLDLLYDIKPIFLEKYGGFAAFAQLNTIKRRLADTLGKEIDLATVDNPSRTFRETALRDVIYV
jgi:predicted nucleotidyltransferase